MAVLSGLLALGVLALAVVVVRSGKGGEAGRTASELRAGLASLIRDWTDSALTELGQLGLQQEGQPGLQQKGQLDSFAGQLVALTASNRSGAARRSAAPA